ncbi:ATP-binding cassette domain-containing protein [Saccharopolyspora shandongensis]|uniref:ATP-binding cassette domain-containing protein n=1 Tax=Saccharopolyspora shandongensis TaxID=418495 RepID=UPI0033D7706A
MVATPLLDIRGLTVQVDGPAGPVTLVDSFDLALAAGDRVALVGESGSGKSVMARSVLQLDPDVALSGSIRLGGTELLSGGEAEAVSCPPGRPTPNSPTATPKPWPTSGAAPSTCGRCARRRTCR